MKGKRGIWTVAIVALVALTMGFLTWPLLRARKKNQAQRTMLVLYRMDSLRRQFEGEHRRPLSDLKELNLPPDDLRDAWGRPIQYRRPGIRNRDSCDLWSLGADPDDPLDDIWPSWHRRVP